MKTYKLELKKLIKHKPFFDTQQQIRYSATAYYGIKGINRQACSLRLRLGAGNKQIKDSEIPQVEITLKNQQDYGYME